MDMFKDRLMVDIDKAEKTCRDYKGNCNKCPLYTKETDFCYLNSLYETKHNA